MDAIMAFGHAHTAASHRAVRPGLPGLRLLCRSAVPTHEKSGNLYMNVFGCAPRFRALAVSPLPDFVGGGFFTCSTDCYEHGCRASAVRSASRCENQKTER